MNNVTPHAERITDLIDVLLTMEISAVDRVDLEEDNITLQQWYQEYLYQTLEKALYLREKLRALKDSKHIIMGNLSKQEYINLITHTND